MALGMPIAFALLASGVALMFHLDMFNNQIVAQNLVNGADNFPLMAVPFFILAGELMNAGGISKRIINFAMALFGHVKGGLGYVAILASVIFAGLSGSAVADAAALGAILIPMMVAAGYDRAQSGGLIAASSIIAPILPPSIPMIIFGVTAGVSITKLFMAGIIPGLLIAVVLTISWWSITRKGNFKVQPKKSFKEIMQAFLAASWALFLPVLIIGGLRGGIFTPTEAAVVSAVYSLIVGLFIYREINLKKSIPLAGGRFQNDKCRHVPCRRSDGLCMVNYGSEHPGRARDVLGPLIENKVLLILAINLLVLLVGTAMDLTPTILILTPVLMPIIEMAGIDPIFFGLIFILNNCVGLLTPPVGTVLNVVAGVGKLSMEQIMKGVWPFLVVETLLLLILSLFPDLVLIPLGWFT